MSEQEEKRITVKVAFNCFQAGNWDRALEEYKKLIAIDPMDFSVHNMLAEIYSRKGDKGEAVREYLHAASLLRATNNMEKALQTYNRILKLEPGHLEAKDKIEEVIKTRLVEVHDLMRRNLFKQAMELCEKLDEKVPDHPLIVEKKAEIEARQKEQPAAAGSSSSQSNLAVPGLSPSNAASDALKRDELVKNLYAMADLYENKQSWDEAVEAYITILRFQPEDDSARSKLHALYRKITRQDKATEVWQRIQTEDKRRIEQFKNLAKDASGLIQTSPGDAAAEASAQLEDSQSLTEPDYSVPKRTEFSDLAEMEKLRLQAEERLRRAVENRRERDKSMRENSAIPASAANAPVACGEPDQSEQDINVLINQAHMYVQQNLLIEAMRLCQRILEVEPQNQDVRTLLQQIFERKKI